ncbi:unnamed protein product [Coregonus sp. 'balchen']|nr:unnamed protein product [Coregonus sp. 'balchen']
MTNGTHSSLNRGGGGGGGTGLLKRAPTGEPLEASEWTPQWSLGLGSGSQLCTNGNAAERWVMQSRTEAVAAGNLNEHIAVALTRLQEDMTNMLQRVNTLEALTTLQVVDR